MPSKKKASSKGAGKASPAAIKSGPVPPYGIAIREAITRGDAQEMRKVGVSARRWIKDIQSALEALEKAIGKKA